MSIINIIKGNGLPSHFFSSKVPFVAKDDFEMNKLDYTSEEIKKFQNSLEEILDYDYFETVINTKGVRKDKDIKSIKKYINIHYKTLSIIFGFYINNLKEGKSEKEMKEIKYHLSLNILISFEKLLNIFGKELTPKIIKQYFWNENFEENIDIIYKTYEDFSSKYGGGKIVRKIFLEILKEGNINFENLGGNIKQKLKKHYISHMGKYFEVFVGWYYQFKQDPKVISNLKENFISEIKPEIEIQIEEQKLFGNFQNFLEECKIYLERDIEKPKGTDTDTFDILKETFIHLIQEQSNIDDVKTTLEELKKKELDFINTKKNFKKGNLEVLMENDLSSISYEEFISLDFNQRNRFVFEKLKNSLTKETDLLSLFGLEENIKSDVFSEFVEEIRQKHYSRVYEKKEFEALIKEQLTSIEENGIGSLESFFKENINDAFLVMGLFKKALKKKCSDGNKIKESTSMIDVIKDKIEKLPGSEKIKSKLHIYSKRRVGNSSSGLNLDWKMKKIQHSLENGGIDFPELKAITKNGKTKKLKFLKDLYIPSDHFNGSVLQWIDKGIDYLKGDISTENLDFEEVLNDLHKNEGIDLNNDDNIREIVKFLQYIKWLLGDGETPGLLKMIKKGESDIEYIKKKFLHIECGNDKKSIYEEIYKNKDTLKEIFGNFSDKGTLYPGEKELIGNTKKSGISIGPVKDERRALEKVVDKYDGNLEKLTDTTRLSIEYDTISDLGNGVAKFISNLSENEEIEEIAIEDKFEDIMEKTTKGSGYRDIKIMAKKTDGNVIEVQFNLKDFLKKKIDGIDLENSEEGSYFLDSLDKSDIKLHAQEFEKIKEVYENKKLETFPKPHMLKYLVNKEEIKKLSFENDNNTGMDKICGDFFYDVSRSLDKKIDKKLIQKLQKMESILYDIALGQSVYKEYS